MGQACPSLCSGLVPGRDICPLHCLAQPGHLLVLWESDQESKWTLKWFKCRKGDWDKLLKWAKSSWWNGAIQSWAEGGKSQKCPRAGTEGSRTGSRQGLSARFGSECWPSSEDEFVLYALGITWMQT